MSNRVADIQVVPLQSSQQGGALGDPFMRESTSRRLTYGAALAAVAAGLGPRWQLSPGLCGGGADRPVFPPGLIAAPFGGPLAGVVVTAVAGIAAHYFVVEPRLELGFKDTGDVVALVLFVLVSTILSALCESLHRARRRILADERRRAEAALSETEGRFRTLVQNS